MKEYYREDLAHIHDQGHSDFARLATPGIISILKGLGLTSGRVVDMGCGSGISAGILVEAGYQVFGLDQSEALLALAAKRVPKARFQKASFWSADLPRCRAVISIGECLGYQFERTTRTQFQALVERVHAALDPGGAFVFDIPEAGSIEAGQVQRSFSEGLDWFVLVEKTETDQLLTRRIVSFRKVGESYRKDEEVHELRLCPVRDVLTDLAEAGFQAEVLRAYGSFPLRRGIVGFLGRKARN